MKIYELVDQVVEVLRRRGRLSYRALKVDFGLDEEHFATLKEELLFSHPEIAEVHGQGFLWKGVSASVPASSTSPPQAPASYTPAHLAERIRAEQVALEARRGTDGERKTITALFADLRGSTALIEGLDPEEARALIDPALQLMMDAVHQYDGYVAQALGDGIFALFGAPLAHEDHPQRALYAALRMQEEMRRYAHTLRAKGHPPLLMRVGVNTGEVVVRSIRKEDLHTDYVPVGHSTNLAARMEQLAAPGSILVTAQTHKLTEGYFTFKALGKTSVKGLDEPLNVYEVVGVGPLRTKLQVAARRGLTQFVGRYPELEQLRRALEQAAAGHGQVVGVIGEPGVGKSRLFYEFKLTAPSGCLLLEAFSVSYGKASPYLPVIELLKTYFQLQPQDEERTRRERIIGKVLGLDRNLEDTLPYFFALVGVEDPASTLQQMDPQIRRRRTFEAVKRLLLRESLNQPLILVFEDLHWLDSETQGLLDVLSESVASARVLLLTNYRPEYQHAWGQKTYYTQLHLAPLGHEEAQELLTVLLGNQAALRSLKQLILEKTQGTPFFMEEVVQTLVEEQVLAGERGNYRVAKAPTELHISPTVQGVLAARIDRLAMEEKALLQQLAVIGREFALSLLRHVIPQPEDELYRVLAVLQNKEFLYEQPAFPEVEYSFKHALTQEVAYSSVLQERRKVLHERAGQAMEALYSASLDDHYSELAYHYTRSGNTPKAITYLHLAGQQAVQRSANAEAVNHLTTALELLKALPDSPTRTQQELTLQLALGAPLMITRGFAVPEVERVYARARELCQQLGETPQVSSALWGLWVFHILRAEYQTAHDLGQQLLRLAQNVPEPRLLVQAHFALGETLFLLGEFVSARAHLEQSHAFYNPQQHRSLAFLSGFDPGIISLTWAAWALWTLGYPAQALKSNQAALTLAQELSHPPSLAYALAHAGQLHRLRREGHAAQERAEATMTLCTEQGIPFFLALSTIMRGWALTEHEQIEEGIAQIRQGMTAWQEMGAEASRSQWLACLAEAQGKGGQTEEGLTVLAEALLTVSKTGERFYEAELYRLKGTLTLQSKVQDPQSTVEAKAEACFHQAVEIARKQQAKSLELRAVMSLSRLWQQQGKQKEAHELLSEIYGWFTEGFDTKDLQEAKALLESLR